MTDVFNILDTPAADAGVEFITVDKTVNTSRSSDIILSADPVLITPTLIASQAYWFTLALVIISVSATPDFKFDINSPQSFSADYTITGASLAGTQYSEAAEDTDINVIDLGGNDRTFLTVQGTFKPFANDIFQLRWAQNVSNATATQVQALSSLMITPIG